MKDAFRGDTPQLISSIEALLSLDAAGALVPHGIGGHARDLLSAAAVRLSASRQEGWQLVPVEPTPEMIAAAGNTPGMRAIDSASATHQLRGNPLPATAFADGSPLHQAYRAMLAAAPHQAQEAQGDRHGE